VDTSRVSFGEMVAGAGGAVLVVAMFLPWFGGRLSGPGVPNALVSSDTGWESFGALFKLVIVLCAAVATGVAVARAMGSLPALPVEQGALVLGAGVLAFAIVGVRMLDPPALTEIVLPDVEIDTSRKAGGFVALAAAAVTAYGGYLQRRERSSG
jgi:hypothetical protein